MSDSLMNRVDCRLKSWNRSAKILLTLYVVLTVFSVIFSTVVGASSAVALSGSVDSTVSFGLLEPWVISILSIASAIMVSLLATLDIRGNANRYREAWRTLDRAKGMYEDEMITKKQLHAAKDEGEAIIANRTIKSSTQPVVSTPQN